MLHEYVMTCEVCQRVKRQFSARPVPTLHLPVAPPWSYFILDHHGPYPPSYGHGHSEETCNHPYKYVLTVVDSSSLWLELIPVENTEAETTFRAIYDRVISRVGLPAGLAFQSDLGSAYTSRLGALFASTFGIKQFLSTFYHHQSNSRAENIAVIVHQSLKALCREQPSSWARHLSAVEMAYRATATSSTHLSPYEVCFGRPMIIGVDRSLCAARPEVPSTDAYAEDIRIKLKIFEDIAMQNSKDAAFQHAARPNEKSVEPSFKNGDKVLLFDPSVKKNENSKLKLRWSGPHFIVNTLPGYNYKLKHVATGKELKNPVHASRLRPFRELDNDYRLTGSNSNIVLFSVTTGKRRVDVQIKIGDVTKTDCQVLVHPYNKNLQPCHPLISNEIGPEIKVDFSVNNTGPLIASEAGYLSRKVSKVYHVVHDDSVDSELLERVRSTVTSCLDHANHVDGMSSIAFPLANATASNVWTLAQAYAAAIRQWSNVDDDNVILRRIEFVANRILEADVFATVFREILTISEERKNDEIDNLSPGVNLPISDTNSQGDWHTIERILRHRKRKGGDEYLVKWEETGTTSWVKRRDVTDAALQEYYNSRKQRRKKRTRS